MESYQTRVLGGFDCMVGCRQGILATIAFSSFIRSRWINLTGAQLNTQTTMKQCSVGVGTVVQSQVALPQNTPPAAARGGTRTKGGKERAWEISNLPPTTRRDAEHHARGGRVRGWAHTLQIGSSGLDWNMFLRYTRATANDTFPLSRYCM